MFHKMPIFLIIMIVGILLLDPFLSLETKSLLFAFSQNIKSLIIFLLPIIIFSLLFKTTLNLAKNASKIILFLLAGICFSNFQSTFLSHFIGSWVYHFDFSMALPKNDQSLTPLWNITFPKLISNDKALFAGILFGLVISYFKPKCTPHLVKSLDLVTEKILIGVICLVPFFIAGFVIKLNHEGNVALIIQKYALIFAIIFTSLVAYLFILYFIASNANLRHCLQSIKNMFPAAITGFSTMSSASAIPLTLLAVEKNTKDSEIAKASIPLTVNIHLIGDCFAIPILAYAILKTYNVPEPAFINYMIFIFYFVVAKFSVAAVPAGGILVMLPVLEKYLGFNTEMLSLITALYILFDPLVTSANVLGNGGFAMMTHKLQKQTIFSSFTRKPSFSSNT